MHLPLLSRLRKVIYRSFSTFLLVIALIVALLSSITTLILVEKVIRDFASDLIGAVEGKEEAIEEVIDEHLLDIVLLSFVPPLLGASLVVLVFRRKVSSALSRLRERASSFARDGDAEIYSLEREDLGFEELNEIKRELIKVFRELEETRISSRLAELELGLTKALLIPYASVRDWSEAVGEILADLSKLMEIDCFVVGFMFSQDEIEIHLFWLCERDPSYEELIKERVRGHYEDLKDIILINHQLSTESRKAQNRELVYIALKDASIGQVVCTGLVISDGDSRELEVVEGFLPALASVVGSARALESYAKEIEYYATRDALTGLYNQRMFWELLEYEVERAKRRKYEFALLMIDIDNFKVINDTYGHIFGDEFLKEFARFLEETFRREDIVARYGGDEFAVILPYTSQEEALKTAKRLLERLENFSVQAPDGKPVKATVSIGVAVYPVHGRDAKELFKVADSTMYRIKAEGKNRVSLPLPEDVESFRQAEGKRGIIVLEALDKGSIVPVFQPIVEVETRKIHAYEVLMRIEKDGKLIPASEFVPTAERMGLIHKLDHILIDKALEKAVKNGFKGRLFFNITPKVLVFEDFIKDTLELVEKHGFNPDQMVFEITERETVRNIHALRDLSMSLKREGFHFAVDDFGSGYSSFMYLKHLPVDYVKIEGEFIRSIINSRMDRAFVISVVALAKTLEIKTVAEFVENEEVYDMVRSLGVDYAQGFYVGRPEPDLR